MSAGLSIRGRSRREAKQVQAIPGQLHGADPGGGGGKDDSTLLYLTMSNMH